MLASLLTEAGKARRLLARQYRDACCGEASRRARRLLDLASRSGMGQPLVNIWSRAAQCSPNDLRAE